MHPYEGLPEERFWRTGISTRIWSDVNFKPTTRFKINGADRIATAGSCFAQHIARHLSSLGLKHHISEGAPSCISASRAKELGYGVFSARYGNIYSARQLRQLIEFAFGLRERVILSESSRNGFIDLLRPGVQAEEFTNLHDLECDREYHLDRVRSMFLESECFIFTLGLTESWFDSESGVVFPVCPGTKAGIFDAKAHLFKNFNVDEIVGDLRWCVEFLHKQNQKLRWIFTVSPVALAATATNQHVLVATAASKAILRVAAETIYQYYENVEYFPSFEITASVATFGQFLDSDLRSISDRGVELVMRVFRNSFVAQEEVVSPDDRLAANSVLQQIEASIQVECDESFSDPSM